MPGRRAHGRAPNPRVGSGEDDRPSSCPDFTLRGTDALRAVQRVAGDRPRRAADPHPRRAGAVRLPASSGSGDVGVGALLRVPFGRQTTLGVVLELARESELEPERLLEPDAVLGPGVGPDLVELAGWIAEQYCSTPARALGLVLPPGFAAGRGRQRVLVAELTEAGRAALGDGSRLTDRQRDDARAARARGLSGGRGARERDAAPPRGPRPGGAPPRRPGAAPGDGDGRAGGSTAPPPLRPTRTRRSRRS